MLRPFMALTAWKTPHVNCLKQSLPFIPHCWMRLGMSPFLHSFLICQTLPLIFFHGCHSCEEEKC